MERGHVRVILDVQRDGFPIRGSISAASGVQRRFHGWMELADVLEAARAATPAAEPVRHGALATRQCGRVLERHP